MREHETVLERAEEKARRPASPAPRSPQLARILALQQSAGNQAVGRMLARLSMSQVTSKDDKRKVSDAKKKYDEHFEAGKSLYKFPRKEDWAYLFDEAATVDGLVKAVDKHVSDGKEWLERQQQQAQPTPQPAQNTAPVTNTPGQRAQQRDPTPKPQDEPKREKKEKKYTPLDLSKIKAASQWDMVQPESIHAADPNPTLPNEILPPLAPVFNLGDFTGPIASWSPNVHAGTSAMNLSLERVQQIVTWLQTAYGRRANVYLRRGEGSGSYSGAMQLKIIHKQQNATGSAKKATYHLSLRPEVYQALNDVEYANADWNGS